PAGGSWSSRALFAQREKNSISSSFSESRKARQSAGGKEIIDSIFKLDSQRFILACHLGLALRYTLLLHARETFQRQLNRAEGADVRRAHRGLLRVGVLGLGGFDTGELPVQFLEESLHHLVDPIRLDVIGFHSCGFDFGARQRTANLSV